LKLASTGPVIPSRGLLLAKVIIRKEQPAAARSSARFVIRTYLGTVLTEY